MMRIASWSALVMVSVALVACELVVDIDRSKLDSGSAIDGSFGDVELPDVVGLDSNGDVVTSGMDSGADTSVVDSSKPKDTGVDSSDAAVAMDSSD